MIYPDRVLEEVRSANNIVDIISPRVKLAKRGKYFFGLCPFHNEKTPSFSVDPDRQIFFCYSCNKGGDAFRFIIETEKLSFPEAVRLLAERAHITLPESSDPEYNKKLAGAKERQKRYLDMYTHAADFFSQALMSDAGRPAREYMQKRSIRADMVRRFGLGYSYPQWDELHLHLRSKGFQDEEQLSGGLILKGKNNNLYDRFRNRVMFPIQDVSGRVLAFGGRALDDSEPKYMNSPETPFYSKGKHLYGLNLAKGAKDKFMIIVEGYMDLISLTAHGIDNVAAPLGTALTEAQAKLLKRYTDSVIIAFDADTAGQAAALRGLDILDGQGIRVRVLTIPEGKDPDDFINARGAAAFRELASGAAPLMDYKIESLRKSEAADGADGDVRFLRNVVRLLAQMSDEVEREIYIGRIATQYKITEDSIKSEIAKLSDGGRRGYQTGQRASRSGNGTVSSNRGSAAAEYGGVPVNPGNNPPGRNAADVKLMSNIRSSLQEELFILALLSIDNSLWDILAEKLPPENVENENARKALIYACDKASRGGPVQSGELMRFFDPEEADRYAGILSKGCHCEDNRRAMDQKIREIKAARAKRQILGITGDIGADGLSGPDAVRIKAQLTEQMKVFGANKTLE